MSWRFNPLTSNLDYYQASGTIIGNLLVKDAVTATKAYRFRTSGADLDFDFAGDNIYLSAYPNADFTGTQQFYIGMDTGGNLDGFGVWRWHTAPFAATSVVIDSGSGTPLQVTGAASVSTNLTVADEVYGAGWDGSLQVPTKNAVYDKIQTLGGGSGITRTITSSSGSFTAGATASTDYVYFLTGAHVPTMPTAVGNTNRYTFKNNHSASITFLTTSSQTIEGGTLALTPEASVDLISNNANWFII